MKKEVHLPPYMMIGSRIAKSGDRLLIDDKFKDRDRALCLLHDDSTGALLLCIIDGILNLDGNTVLILGTSDPEEMESEYQSYFVVKLVSPTAVELLEEKLIESISEIVEEAIEINRQENLLRVESVFGTLRVFDFSTESVPFSKKV